jgi:thiosulfate/3-mercaptopyruvate sulfurtransferase
MEVFMTTRFHTRRNPRAAGVGAASLILGALLAWFPATPARSDGPAPPPKPVESWKDAERITPEELVKILRAPGAEKPAMFQVGFRVLFAQAHIPGSKYAGPGVDPSAVEALGKSVSALPKTTPIVLYCGCCPWERCPNLERPWAMLRAAGFTRVQVLFIPKNFGQDWVQKGYPAEAGEPGRG